MPKKKSTKSDEAILRHYSSANRPTLPTDDENASPPRVITPDISVDHVLNQRKSAVIKMPASKVDPQNPAKPTTPNKTKKLNPQSSIQSHSAMPQSASAAAAAKETLKHITCYDAPPQGFDPFTADEKLLRKHGVPRRPHPENEAHLRGIWDRAFASKPTFIKAEVSVDPILSRRKRPVVKAPAAKSEGKKGKDKLGFSPSGWAGAVQQVANLHFNPAEPVVTAYGEWFIPTITATATEPNTAETVGFWVGIDGFGNSQVLQAGSAATITGKNIAYWVWTEWYPIGAISINNFPVKPGDYLTVLVCANTPTHGFCSMMNKTTNQVTSIGITNPAGVTSIGATAEWIVEGVSDILPVFSTIVFQNCSAGTKNHTMNCHAATIAEITGAGGANLTVASVPSDTSAMVKWLKAT